MVKSMQPLLHKLKGGQPRPPSSTWPHALSTGAASFIAVGLLAWLTETGVHPLVLGSFGASCVLLFGYPDSPFSQPRNIVLGHTLSTLVGLLVLQLVGVHWWSMALAVALSIVLMMRAGVMHPPAGSNPLIVMLLQPGWLFAFTPTLIGALLLVVMGLVLINLQKDKHYPRHW
jgi:CBS-domain-containing membrane protein